MAIAPSDLKKALAGITPRGTRVGDHVMNPDWWHLAQGGVLPIQDEVAIGQGANDLGRLKAASVLVAFFERADGITILLTKRSSKLRRHAGQVAFPGGRREPDDADAVACALREAEEEVALPTSAVEVLGQLDDYVSRTGYLITPVLGWVTAKPDFTAQPSEVEEIFEVSAPALLDPANHVREVFQLDGIDRHYHRIPGAAVGAPYDTWGVTAGILVELATRLDGLG